jgi:copper(I)-binding protein
LIVLSLMPQEALVKPTNRRAVAALVAGAAVALGLVGCRAGQITQTAHQVSAVPGANVDVGGLALRDLQIAYAGQNGYPAGGNAPLIIRIFNEGAKTIKLTGVSAPGTAQSVVLSGGTSSTPAPTTAAPSPTATGSPSPTGSPAPSGSASPSPTAAPTQATPAQAAPAGQSSFSIEIPAQGYVLLVPGQGQFLQLVGLARQIIPGELVTIEFTFDDGSKASASVPFAPAPEPVRGSPVVPGEKVEHE